MLSMAPGRICLTTDNWKSNHTRQHYICVTAHFIDDAWKLHKRILRFRALDPPYDGVSIANEIGLFLGQWSLEQKVFTITTDNATYNDVMIATIRKRLLPRGELSSSDRFFHVRCCAHILNLVVQSGLACINDILENIRTLVKMITKSSRRSKDFYDCADKIFHLDVKKKLNLDMQIRWNSTHKMLDTVLYFKDVFSYLGSYDSVMKSYIPLDSEWEKAAVVHKFLKLFYEVTCMFSAIKYPTSNLYFKGAWMVHQCMLEAMSSQYDYLANMVRPMLVKFDKYWSDYNLYLSCAAILDPRFKLKFVEYCFSKLFGVDEAMQRVDLILATLHSLFDEYKLQASSVPIALSCVGFDSDNYFEDYDHFSGRCSGSQTKKSQLDVYLDEPALDLNMELDILDFWRKNSVRYPELSRMARDLLTIPVSTVASESAFSLGGKTISPTRSSLKSKTIQALICVQDWRRAEYDTNMEFGYDSILEDEIVDEEEGDANTSSSILAW